MKIIKNENDYEKALTRIEELMEIDPNSGTDLYDELELLSYLVEKYEDEHYPISIPNPIEAIKFRMEQLNLKYSDMSEYLGSKSKVSEVLNGKRKLSLNMIRKLHYDLGIPANILISDPEKKIPEEIPDINWLNFPLSEMLKKEWLSFEGSLQNAKEHAEEIIRDFFNLANLELNKAIYLRQSIRANSYIDEYGLSVWFAKASIEEQKMKIGKKYNSDLLTDEFINDLRKLSIFDTGVSLAQELLAKIGIKLVILPHLKKTHIDGATFLNLDKNPVIVLTLRYDRIDSFWFTLFHEIAHVKLHLNDESDKFIDDLKANKDLDNQEKEADKFAEDNLIRSDEWREFDLNNISDLSIKSFATKYKISEAIIVGRIQKELNDYSIKRKYLGQGKVKKLFIK